jgi:hypothetical protein
MPEILLFAFGLIFLWGFVRQDTDNLDARCIRGNISQEIKKEKNYQKIAEKQVKEHKERLEKIHAETTFWPDYIISLIKREEEESEKAQQELEKIQNQIYELETKIDFYYLIPEENFWQYLRSMKWIKKVKT